MEHPIFGRVIHSYTRADMLADGSLIDVTKQAKEAGFKIPVAVTSAVWEGHIKVEGTKRSGDTQGRLWDALWLLFVTINRSRAGGSRIDYQVIFGRKLVALKALIGPGDQGEPVLTIMMPEED